MVRLTVELINDSLQYLNTVRDRELSLRACKIPVLENLGITKVNLFLRRYCAKDFSCSFFNLFVNSSNVF